MHIWWRLPDYWYWIVPLLVLAAVIFCAVIWRKYLLGTASILSLAMFLFIAITWIITWTASLRTGVVWRTKQPNGGFPVWRFEWTACHGGLRLSLYGHHYPPQMADSTVEIGSRTFIWDFQEQQPYYPLWNDRFTLTKSDFIQKTLGFQVCWWSTPIIPYAFTPIGMYSITVPHWFAMLLCLPIPAWWLKHSLRKRSRVKRGICVKCAYDLRASTDKCPECGTAIPRRKEIAKSPDAAKPAA